MTYLLLFLLLLFNSLILLLKKKSKFVVYYSILFFSLIMGGNNYSADFWAYEENYKLVQTDDSYFGFDFLWGPFMKIGGYLGLSYNGFLLTTSFLAYSVLFIFLYRRNGYNIHKIIILYTLYSFFVDAIQVANFFANVLAILALYKIFDYKESKKKKDLAIALILSFCGLGFHASISVLFILFLFKETYIIKYLVSISIIFTFVDTFLGHLFIDKIFALLPIGELYMALKDYGTNVNSGFGFVLYTAIIFVLIYLIRINVTATNSLDMRHLKLSLNSVFFLRFVLMLSPVFAISTITYIRFFRVIMIYYGNNYEMFDKGNARLRLYTYTVLATVFVYFFFSDVGIDNFFDIMDNNILFE